MECFSLGASVSHLKSGTGEFTFYLRFSSVMVPEGCASLTLGWICFIPLGHTRPARMFSLCWIL